MSEDDKQAQVDGMHSEGFFNGLVNYINKFEQNS